MPLNTDTRALQQKDGTVLSQLIPDDHSECQKLEHVIKGNKKNGGLAQINPQLSPFSLRKC